MIMRQKKQKKKKKRQSLNRTRVDETMFDNNEEVQWQQQFGYVANTSDNDENGGALMMRMPRRA